MITYVPYNPMNTVMASSTLLDIIPNIPYYDMTISIGVFATMAVVMKRLPKWITTWIDSQKHKGWIKFGIVLGIGAAYGYTYHMNGVPEFADLNTAIITGLVSAIIASGTRDGAKNAVQTKVVTEQIVVEGNDEGEAPIDYTETP